MIYPIYEFPQSAAAQYVDRVTAAQMRRLRTTNALGSDDFLNGALADIFDQCSLPNWDGYGALAVGPEALGAAQRVVRSLPPGMAAPSVGAEPDGQITLEWHHSRRRTLSISVNPERELHFAALLGPSSICGKEFFYGSFPSFLNELVHKVLSA